MIKKERDPFIDCMRGLAILLVVLGHSIQFGNGSVYLDSGAFFENIVFKVIYGFHMPLFMVISGYLFWRTIDRKSIGDLLKSRLLGLLLPIIVWGIVDFLIRFALLHTISIHDPISLAKKLVGSSIGNLWFLWAVFFNSLLVILIYKYLRNSLFAYLAFGILMLITPDSHNFGDYKFMFPFFVFPFLIGKTDLRAWFKKRNILELSVMTMFTLALYVIAMYYWKSDYYIYTTGITILDKRYIDQLLIDIVRWGVGFIGLILVFSLFHIIEKTVPFFFKKLGLDMIGKRSLAIYILSGFCFTYFVPQLTHSLQFNWINVLLISIVVSIVTLIISIGITRSRVLNLVLLGGRS